MDKKSSNRSKALEIIKKSGVVNPNISLGEIMDISSRLDIIDDGTLSAWTFVSPNYVYKGDDPTNA